MDRMSMQVATNGPPGGIRCPGKNKEEPAAKPSHTLPKKANNAHGILKPDQRPRSKSQSVSFGTVKIREYPIIPGDNPGSLSGPPLTVDWEHQTEFHAPLDDYERKRPPRRTASEICIPPNVRQKILKQQGFSDREILKYHKQANIVRGRRKQSVEMAHMGNISLFAEKMKRSVSNATVGRGKKQREREYLKQCQQQEKTEQPPEKSQVFTDATCSDEEMAAA